MAVATTYTTEQDLFILDNHDSMSFIEIGRKLGRSRHQVRGRLIYLMEQFRSWINDIRNEATETKVTRETSDNSDVICMIDPDVKSVDELIEVMKIDLKVWKISKAVCNKWGGFARTRSFKEGPGDFRRQLTKVPLYQVKVWLERIDGATINNEKLRRELIAELSLHSPRYPKVRLVQMKSAERVMAELSIPDPHFGKLCWGSETGAENWDLKITKSAYLSAVENMLRKIHHHPVEKILLPVGNDLLHTDGMENQTTAGTPQDVDGRWQKAFRVATQSVIQAVEMCREVAPVEVMVVPGNHDYERTFYLGDVIAAHFRLCDNVNVDNRPLIFKWMMYGKTLLGFVHGDKVSHATLPMLLANAAPMAFAKATHKELHLGHLHTRRHSVYRAKNIRPELNLEVSQGVHVRIIPSLCPPDAWHAQHGYMGSPRAAETYLWEADSGFGGMFSHSPIAVK